MNLNVNILVTGGLGFIGSHICVTLLENNYNVIVIDNLSNSKIDVLDKIKFITKRDNITFCQEDLLDKNKITEIFKNNNIHGIIHCAGLKSVGESIQQPLKYYYENLTMTINLLQIIKQYSIKKFVFSSSATVYGSVPNDEPFKETDTIGQNITNPYGQTKFMQEVMLKDYASKNKDTNFIILRYFNPVGAHKSGLIGENPNGIPNNLMPYILRVAANNNTLGFNENVYEKLTIFGNDYNTKDGTCIRDFIHVVDLANAHLKAIQYNPKDNYEVFNIGTGNGNSVLEMVETFKKVNNVELSYVYGSRREGDPDIVTCITSKANEKLGWKTKLTFEDMVKDSWNFIIN